MLSTKLNFSHCYKSLYIILYARVILIQGSNGVERNGRSLETERTYNDVFPGLNRTKTKGFLVQIFTECVVNITWSNRRSQ